MDEHQTPDTPSGTSRWFMGAVQLIFVVGVIGLALAFSAILKPKQNDRGASTFSGDDNVRISVSVTTPAPETFSPTIRINGVVSAQTQMSIAPQVGGQVVRVSQRFKQGALVKKGQMLFQIDPRDFQLAVEQAEANISAASSDLQILKAEADLAIREYKELFPNEQIGDLAARKPQMAAARARLDAATAAKQTASLALSRTTVRAADDMKILATTLNTGQIVAPNQSVGQAFATRNIEISAPLSISELDVLTPAVGRKATLIVNGNNQAVRAGEVVRVDAVLDARTRLANLFVRPETPEDLIVGNFVDVIISGDSVNDALALPESAMADRDTVWVVSKDQLQSRTVRRLGERDGLVMVSGFDIADGVLTLPPTEIVEGQKARIREAGK